MPFEALHEALDAGHTVITSTRRLARATHTSHGRRQAAPSWPTPDVLSWAAWLEATFRQLRDFGLIPQPQACLDEWQSTALWEEVLAADEIAATLLMPGRAVDGFREAWRLAHEWQLPWPQLEARAGEDCRVFLRVAAAYRQRLRAAGSLDAAQLPALLARELVGRAGPPVLFAGFDGLHPAQRAVVQALGARARSVASPHRDGVASLAAFPDGRTELAAAADWARARLEENPSARLGIVVPDLEAQAPLLEDLLDEALAPERLLPGRGDAPRPWNLAHGQPLLDVPVVAAAFLLFELTREQMKLYEVGRLLRSPYVSGGVEEGARRARLEAWLREHAGDRITPRQLLAWLGGRDRAPGCRRLASGVAGLLDEVRAGPGRRRPSAWAAALTRGLGRLGWPGDAPLDSPTWQSVQAWADLLEGFSRLDTVTSPMRLADALGRLRRMAGRRRFQPETPDLPVQVLGLSETAGQAFDALWVSGLHDGALPLPLRPCPLLPAALQREQRLPRACPATELALARRMVARLANAAPEVRFSYPQARDDEPLRPSPVLIGLAPHEGLMSMSRPGLAATGFATRKLESVADTVAPPVTGEVHGGTGLLAAQSACPFKAFAVHRLAARPLDAPAAGIDPATRGQFVHLALSELWRELKNLHGLAALDAAGRARQVRAALARAADVLLPGQPPGLVRIELDEASRRIEELLLLETSRLPFEVEARELRVGVALGPLRINGQVDRLDRVAEGLVVIDYKTGEASVSKWHGERPEEPQMPLYALAFSAELAALAYASLKPGKVGLKGVACTVDAFGPTLAKQGIALDEAWPTRLEEWRRVLETLAGGFAAGDARVDPLRVSGMDGTCARCHLATLCRRDELLRAGVLGNE